MWQRLNSFIRNLYTSIPANQNVNVFTQKSDFILLITHVKLKLKKYFSFEMWILGLQKSIIVTLWGRSKGQCIATFQSLVRLKMVWLYLSGIWKSIVIRLYIRKSFFSQKLFNNRRYDWKQKRFNSNVKFTSVWRVWWPRWQRERE